MILCGDCITEMQALTAGSVDLIFADPPFNIGYSYDSYVDRRGDYIPWAKNWLREIYRVCNPTGTFWLAAGDSVAAELKIAAEQSGLFLRSWCIWHYTFGVNCQRKFTRSHTHLLYFTKDKDCFTFNDAAVRVPSWRQLNGDKRADPRGRLPDDVWTVPRVAGTHRERRGPHGCQMPESILERIISVSSHPGELVLDPFVGSGTTVAVAKRLGRAYIGIDISATYVAMTKERLG